MELYVAQYMMRLQNLPGCFDDMDTEAKTIEGYRKIAQEVFPNAPMIPESQLHDLFMKDYNLICMGKFTKHGNIGQVPGGLPARVVTKKSVLWVETIRAK
jgi:hypothetical protein